MDIYQLGYWSTTAMNNCTAYTDATPETYGDRDDWETEFFCDSILSGVQ